MDRKSLCTAKPNTHKPMFGRDQCQREVGHRKTHRWGYPTGRKPVTPR